MLQYQIYYMKKKISIFFLYLSLTFGLTASASIIPNDPFYSHQWYLNKIKADIAWEKVSASPDITIAVIDSGVQINHPDLKNNIWKNLKEISGNGIDDDRNGFVDDVNGWDFVGNSNDPSPKLLDGWTEAGASHGTMVSGIIAAEGNNAAGVTGITWKAKIMPLRVLNDQGEGRMSNVVRAIDYAVNNGADIINLSFVGFNYNEGVADAVKRAYDQGVIIVAAAGNEQSDGGGYNTDKNPIYPACYDGKSGENMILGVAAMDVLDQKAKFSSFGFKCVDLSAPGVSFFNTITYGSNPSQLDLYYDGYWSGTSMAAPVVSGVLALVMEVNPNLSRQEIINILLGTSDNVSQLNPAYLGQLGFGRVNAARAVDAAREKLYNESNQIISAPAGTNSAINLKVVTDDGGLIKQFSAYPNWHGGVNIAAGDVDGDGAEEIVVAPMAGGGPHIRVFSRDGELKRQFFAYDKNFKGGVSLAVGDLDDDGKEEILTAPASSSLPVRMFSTTGHLKGEFFPYGKDFKGGVNIAIGNVDGRGSLEIVTTPASLGGPQVKVFSNAGRLRAAFFAYDKNFKGGLNVAVANVDGRANRHKQEIIVAPMGGMDPIVKVFNDQALLRGQFLAFASSWQKGVNLAAADLNHDGLAEIITAARAGGSPQVRTFNFKGRLQDSFMVYDLNFSGGVNINTLTIKN